MKTTFRRQITLIICVLLAATMLTGMAFWAVFEYYTTQERERSLGSTADSVAQLVEAYSASYLNDWSFRTNLSVASAASENDILICDTGGTVRICARDIQRCTHLCIDGLAGSQGFIQFQITDDITKGGCCQVFDCHHRIFHTVGKQSGVGNLIEHNRINSHGNVILCDNRLRREVRYLFL